MGPAGPVMPGPVAPAGPVGPLIPDWVGSARDVALERRDAELDRLDDAERDPLEPSGR
jgi:hypothetical protein